MYNDHVYYDTEVHCFRTIRDRESGVVSAPTKFYDDSKTTRRTETLTEDRIEEDLVEVEDPLDFEYVQFNDAADGWEIARPGPDAATHEDLVDRISSDGKGVDVTGLEGLELMAAAAEKLGGRVVVEMPNETDFMNFLAEYAAKRTKETML